MRRRSQTTGTGQVLALDVLSAEQLADLAYTYEQLSATGVEPAQLAATLVCLIQIKGKYLQLLNDKAGGGFEPTWYWRVHGQTEQKMQEYLT